jgi:KUP system potassium uptake protein
METSIQFADEHHRSRKSTSSQGIGGVVPLRHRSLSRKRTNSIDVRDKIAELEDPEDEDAGLRDDRDYKTKQVRKACAN